MADPKTVNVGTKPEDQIFGDVKGDNKAPVESGKKDREVTISEEALKAMLERLEVLEADKTAKNVAEDDIFNPLKEIKTNHTLRVTYFNDKLVVGYVGKTRPDGVDVYVTNEVIETGEFRGQMRGYATLKYEDGKTEKVDHLNFLQNCVGITATIVARKDIGKVVEQGEVQRMSWNGRALVPTSTRIMTGYKQQKFEFEVEHNNKRYTLPENVTNIN